MSRPKRTLLIELSRVDGNPDAAAAQLNTVRSLAECLLSYSITSPNTERTVRIETPNLTGRIAFEGPVATTTGYHDNDPMVGAKLSAADVARICHEANAALCRCYGDGSQPSFEDAPEWQVKSAVDGVLAIIEGRVKSPEDSHESWKAQKIADGWKFGPVKNPDMKEHPCIVENYDMLPSEQRVKDHVYFAIVKSIAAFGNPG